MVSLTLPTLTPTQIMPTIYIQLANSRNLVFFPYIIFSHSLCSHSLSFPQHSTGSVFPFLLFNVTPFYSLSSYFSSSFFSPFQQYLSRSLSFPQHSTASFLFPFLPFDATPFLSSASPHPILVHFCLCFFTSLAIPQSCFHVSSTLHRSHIPIPPFYATPSLSLPLTPLPPRMSKSSHQ